MDALHPQRELRHPEQRSPAIADDQKQSSPPPQSSTSTCQSSDQHHEKVKLKEINPYLTCHLCKGYLIDATTISECLHSFCRSCIIKFLEDNSFCPVCEVIINKAKPNLKLDKTLQDIVYKLVPGLFLAEMLRRKRFYAERPGRAAGVSPEQRGEDTERTIFNPQDRISLSLEYIGDAATSGIILKDLRTTLERQEAQLDSDSKKSTHCDDVQAETQLKRYLQCPGMCRIDVIKKFIRNKYNVNTDLFQIDILYKRVPLPLPDHYTLIDVAYIYTWKRNEPMRFYFRIIDKGNDDLPDLTKVFTPIEAPPLLRPQARSTPTKKMSRPTAVPDRKKRTPKKTTRKTPASPKPIKKEDCNNCDKDTIESELSNGGGVKVEVDAEKLNARSDVSVSSDGARNVRLLEDRNGIIEDEIKKEREASLDSDFASRQIKKESDCNDVDVKEQVYTNITLDRSNNVEIITKIHKVSGKDGQPFGMNIINQTVKKTKGSSNLENEVQNTTASDSEAAETKVEVKQETPALEPDTPVVKQEAPTVEDVTPASNKETKEPPTPPANMVAGLTEKELEQKKFEFLKSIELTSKKVVDNLAKLLQKQQAKALFGASHNSANKGNVSSSSSKPYYSIKPPVPNAAMEIVKTKKSIAPKPGTNGVKRKNSSPIKNESKRSKVEHKRTTKIILQQKPGFPAINPLKPNEINQTTLENTMSQSKDLHSLFQNCRLNIPSSLSITLKENGETSRKPLQMPPVQNYIEILKIDEKEGKKTITLKREDSSSGKNFENNEPSEIPQISSELSIVASPFGNNAHNPSVSMGPQEPNATPALSKNAAVSTTESSNKIKDSKEISTKNQQSFQKIFEESIKKSEVDLVSPESSANILNGSGKRNILEIAQQLYKKTKTQQDTQKNSSNSFAESHHSPRCSTPLSVPKIAIPRLNNQRVVKPPKRSQKYENSPQQASTNQQQSNSFGLPHQTLTNLHSSSLGLNYTVSVSKQSKDPIKQTYRVNGVMSSPHHGGTQKNVKNGETNAKSPKNRTGIEQTGTPAASTATFPSVAVKSSPSSPKSVAVKVPAGQFSPKVPKVPPHSPRPKMAQLASKPEQGSLPSPKNMSPRNYSSKSSPVKSRSTNSSPKLAQSAGSSSVSSTSSSALTPNELLEKYNIQNLAQLSASMNFNAAAAPQNYLNAVQGTQMAALHQAMLLKQFELQNRQKWLNINQGPLLQFEKYLQSLNASKNQILGNLKDN